MSELAPEEWGNRYRAIRGSCLSLTGRLRALVVDLLAEAGMEVIQIESRTKEVESFVEKISRKRAKYRNPLTEITDLVGLRIITYYLEDVVTVGEILKKEFQIDATNTVDKAAGLDPDRFGYSSVHYVVSLSPDRRKLAEWRPYAAIRAEIQIRTALQHAWSAVNHKLDYKSPTEVPRELRRRLFRLSALFELADEQFSELRDARAALTTEYAEGVRDGQLDIPLNESSITVYLRDSGKRDAIARMVTESGGRIVEPDDKRLTRDRRDLLRLLNWVGIASIAQLDKYLTAEVFGASIAGTPVFRGDGAGIEDALTLLIMADKRVGKDIYGKIYAGDWDEFAAKTEAWHSRKRRRLGTR
jgi:ppGpp synthetase/RelA/SpoT-type nucleotidyltranferase